MPVPDAVELTERQKRELEYHRDHAKEHQRVLSEPFSWDVLNRPSRRWWNAYWQMYDYLIKLNLKGKRVLVVGCGFGEDALRIAKLGAEVYAFDLSPESLSLAKRRAELEGLNIHFAEMPAEEMKYESDFFDCVVARDILHHVEVPRTIAEIRRVVKNEGVFVINEIYSHSVTDRIRHSPFVEKRLYPRMQRFVYGHVKPYITEDERKLTEADLVTVLEPITVRTMEKYFNLLVTRIFPDRFTTLAKADRIALMCLKPIGRFLAGRVLFAGRISK
jgi:ubiquinone/menaquinone biosynthesis C-methylase UbiE